MKTIGKVIGVVSNLVTIEADGPVSQNEICFVTVQGRDLMAEVIKVDGKHAIVQVFESTRGMKVGDEARFEQHMLEVQLGPGMLSKNYDGLQNDLDKMEGVFLRRGTYTDPLDREKLWGFKPLAEVGSTVQAGSWLGEVNENDQPHRIMVPFVMTGNYVLKSLVPEGEYTVDQVIAVVEDSNGKEHELTMVQKWPVKKAITCYSEKPRPFKLLETGVRVIDTMNPIVEGGTGFIPGAFGTGKTVLQHAISKQADADIVIMAACGERANEVVEMFKEYPHLEDPHTGRKLMERTIIIANTSNMPVAAREASVYTAMTIAEYYRSMGLKVLLMADSTSRWAQALREMSNRLEELPGPDGFPMDLSAIISNFYARAGFVYLNNGKTGSVTFIGTVSPAGGNLKEPVTENTQKVARCFYALEQNRADRKRYPAVNPLDSYSKYLDYPEFVEYMAQLAGEDWLLMVNEAKRKMLRGREMAEQINILGDDGVPVSNHDVFWKSELIDFIIYQQDAFDAIDQLCPLERQKYMLSLVMSISEMSFDFEDFEEVGEFFKQLINYMKQMNYSEYLSEDFKKYESKVHELVGKHRVMAEMIN